MERCSKEVPTFVEVESGHWVACLRATEGCKLFEFLNVGDLENLHTGVFLA
jgi:hypothetical protein